MQDFLNRKEVVTNILTYKRKTTRTRNIIVIAISIILAMWIVAGLSQCVQYRQATPTNNKCVNCHNYTMAMTEYFKINGNKTPEEMAIAVLATKNPRLLAAIAVKGEKNTPYTVRKGGWKKQHAGAWQMNQRLHKKAYGVVPTDPIGQALQAEKYLVDLSKEFPIEKVLSQYGGDSTDKYANRVLAEILHVP